MKAALFYLVCTMHTTSKRANEFYNLSPEICSSKKEQKRRIQEENYEYNTAN